MLLPEAHGPHLLAGVARAGVARGRRIVQPVKVRT